MCHHVDMGIDWEEVVTQTEPEVEEADEPAVDTGESTPELTLPADD